MPAVVLSTRCSLLWIAGEFLGTGYLRMASILSGTELTVLLQMMCLRNFISGLQKFHLEVLLVNPAVVNLRKARSRCSKLSWKVDEWISRSSTWSFIWSSPKTVSSARINADKLFLKPYGTDINCYTLLWNWKSVYYLDTLPSGTCKNELLRVQARYVTWPMKSL